MLTRGEILELLDPEWRERYRGDVELAWAFYIEFAKSDIDRVKREYAAEDPT
jgi:hypothetical protein